MTWTTLAAAVTFWCIGAAWGAGMTRRSDDYRYARLVADDASQRSAIRDLYRAEGYADPDFYAEAEPEPQPRWWRRVWEWGKGKQAPVVMDGDVPMSESLGHDEAEEEAAEWVDGDCGWCGGECHCGNAPKVKVEPNEPNFVHDPEPKTNPIRMPEPTGPVTQPAAAVIDADWEARSQQMLAEARATIAKIGGGR